MKIELDGCSLINHVKKSCWESCSFESLLYKAIVEEKEFWLHTV
jgi:hypothetical protein